MTKINSPEARKDLAVGIAVAMFIILAEGAKRLLELWYDWAQVPPVLEIIMGTGIAVAILGFFFLLTIKKENK